MRFCVCLLWLGYQLNSLVEFLLGLLEFVPSILHFPAGEGFGSIVPPPNTAIEDLTLPYIIMWDPLISGALGTTPKCPLCNVSLTGMRWTDASTASLNPRKLYGIESTVLLLSRMYRCSMCKTSFLAHDARILCQGHPQSVPFVLLHKSGFTRALVDMIHGLVRQGMSFYAMETLLAENYWTRYCSRQVALVSSMAPNFNPDTADLVSNDLIEKCFLSTFRQEESRYNLAMTALTATDWIAFDHTFKVASNIGYYRAGKWIKQYGSAFFVISEGGQVLGWQFTDSTSLDDVSPLLQGIVRRHRKAGIDIKRVCVDNCCQVRGKLYSLFGENITINLDLFHAVQRVKRKLSSCHTYYNTCLSDFAQRLRDAQDKGDDRKMATPSPSIIESNIRNWVKKWLEIGGDLITESVLSEIENLLVHVRHGCLSGIPRGCGTNRNENLHMLLNRHFNRSRIGVLLAYALLSVTIYTYNNKIHFKGKTVTPPVTSLAVETDSDTDEHFGIVPKTPAYIPP